MFVEVVILAPLAVVAEVMAGLMLLVVVVKVLVSVVVAAAFLIQSWVSSASELLALVRPLVDEAHWAVWISVSLEDVAVQAELESALVEVRL